MLLSTLFRFTGAAALFSILSSGCATAPDTSTPSAQISVEDSTLYWNGPIDIPGVEKAAEVFERHAISAFNVQSRGGNPMAAMQLGYLLHRNSTSLTVSNYCLEACANYVFTAAASQKLPDEAIVAWSGGALEASWTRQWGNYVVPGIRGAIEKYTDSYLRRETRFFERIGVDQRITFYGYDEHVGCMQDTTVGFYYGPGDLLSMGLGQTDLDINNWEQRYLNSELEFCKVDLSNRLLLISD